MTILTSLQLTESAVIEQHCNSVLAGVSKAVNDKPQQLLNTAARRHDTGRYTRGLEVMMHRCLNDRAPQYTSPTIPLRIQRHIRSAERNLLHVTLCNSSEYYSPRGVYNSVSNHLHTFATWRTRTRSSIFFSPSTALSRTL